MQCNPGFSQPLLENMHLYGVLYNDFIRTVQFDETQFRGNKMNKGAVLYVVFTEEVRNFLLENVGTADRNVLDIAASSLFKYVGLSIQVDIRIGKGHTQFLKTARNYINMPFNEVPKVYQRYWTILKEANNRPLFWTYVELHTNTQIPNIIISLTL